MLDIWKNPPQKITPQPPISWNIHCVYGVLAVLFLPVTCFLYYDSAQRRAQACARRRAHGGQLLAGEVLNLGIMVQLKQPASCAWSQSKIFFPEGKQCSEVSAHGASFRFKAEEAQLCFKLIPLKIAKTAGEEPPNLAWTRPNKIGNVHTLNDLGKSKYSSEASLKLRGLKQYALISGAFLTENKVLITRHAIAGMQIFQRWWAAGTGYNQWYQTPIFAVWIWGKLVLAAVP